jgi:ribulose-phosphate 3-epimerase
MSITPHPVFPSILSTDYFNLEDRLNRFQLLGINYIHLDVMDGHFVDNLSFGPSASTAIKSKFNFKIDAHLMVSNPAKMIPKFIAAGSDWVSFHVEAVSENEIHDTIQLIKKENRKAGLVLNPDTPAETIFPYLDQIDYVLLMSVFPGRGGQKFIPATIHKVEIIKKQMKEVGIENCVIQVDGGINASNIHQLKRAGADLFVIGTFLFNSENIENTLESIQKNLNNSNNQNNQMMECNHGKKV